MIRLAVALLLAGVIASMARAEPFPAAYSVRGVAAGDVLNIRAEPMASAPIVGTIGPYALNIEVLGLSSDGRWGQVGVPEGAGWVAMRFLDAQPVSAFELPRPLTCLGTEPFWRLSFFPRGAEWAALGEDRADLTVLREGVAPGGYLAVMEEGPTLTHTAIITRGQCSDGMSDRPFGLRVTLFTEAADGNRTLSGCCTLDHR